MSDDVFIKAHYLSAQYDALTELTHIHTPHKYVLLPRLLLLIILNV